VRLRVGLLSLLVAGAALAKNPEQPETSSNANAPDTTFLDHDTDMPFWFGAEMNSIGQFKPGFAAPYSGPNSMSGDPESAISVLFTAFFAYSPFRTTELIADIEMALGGGLSGAVGLAGYSNLDVVRNPSLGHEPYVARAQVHQIIPLSPYWERNEDRGPISTLPYLPRHRLSLRVGKMSTADLFDINPVGSDSHMQFMNWAIDNNGAWDYAADTRGYTFGFIVEYQGPYFEVRLGEMMMPAVANGLTLDPDLARAHATNFELEVKYSRVENYRGTLRVLVFENRANMGLYALANEMEKPDITATRAPGRQKVGFGFNVVQELGLFRAFSRGGWNNGITESFAYTEIDNTFQIGADLKGKPWKRKNDRIGLAFASNGLSQAHAEYLQKGGIGFILGDGTLSYARETIFEVYYNVQIWRGAFAAVDTQFIANPGYNHDRGPVWVFSLRGHLEF
jgi:hypothetical protein